jgi:hypothetical protein
MAILPSSFRKFASDVQRKIRHCFFSADKSKMVNSVSVLATSQHFETPIKEKAFTYKPSRFCCQDKLSTLEGCVLIIHENGFSWRHAKYY